MTAPRLGMGMPPDDSWVGRRLDDLQRQLNELRAARTLEAATIGKGGLTIAGGSLVVEDASGNVIDTVDASGITVSGGKLVVDGSGVAESGNYAPGSAGWALQPNGNAEFNDLTLRGGIIGDQALANPAAFGVISQDWDTLTFTTANLVKTTTLAVPAGYSRALVCATAVAGCQASASAVANLYVSCTIQGVQPEFVATQAAANFAGSVSRGYAASLSGLSGGSVSVGAIGTVDSNASVVAGSCNLHVNAAVIFLR